MKKYWLALISIVLVIISFLVGRQFGSSGENPDINTGSYNTAGGIKKALIKEKLDSTCESQFGLYKNMADNFGPACSTVLTSIGPKELSLSKDANVRDEYKNMLDFSILDYKNYSNTQAANFVGFCLKDAMFFSSKIILSGATLPDAEINYLAQQKESFFFGENKEQIQSDMLILLKGPIEKCNNLKNDKLKTICQYIQTDNSQNIASSSKGLQDRAYYWNSLSKNDKKFCQSISDDVLRMGCLINQGIRSEEDACTK